MRCMDSIQSPGNDGIGRPSIPDAKENHSTPATDADILSSPASGIVLEKFHEYVVPTENPTLSEFCVSLTGISQDIIDLKAIPLALCLQRFRKWMKTVKLKYRLFFPGEKETAHDIDQPQVRAAFLTWTSWDLGCLLPNECKRKNLRVPEEMKAWIDLKILYKECYGSHPGGGLRQAMADLGLDFSGREHSGIVDAANTATLASKFIADGHSLRLTRDVSGVKYGTATRSTSKILATRRFDGSGRQLPLGKEDSSKKMNPGFLICARNKENVEPCVVSGVKTIGVSKRESGNESLVSETKGSRKRVKDMAEDEREISSIGGLDSDTLSLPDSGVISTEEPSFSAPALRDPAPQEGDGDLIFCGRFLRRSPLQSSTPLKMAEKNVELNSSPTFSASMSPSIIERSAAQKESSLTSTTEDSAKTPTSEKSLASLVGKLLDTDSPSVRDTSLGTAPLCQCGMRAKLSRVNLPGPNQDRWFYACKRSRPCEYFSWTSSSPGSTANSSHRRVPDPASAAPPRSWEISENDASRGSPDSPSCPTSISLTSSLASLTPISSVSSADNSSPCSVNSSGSCLATPPRVSPPFVEPKKLSKRSKGLDKLVKKFKSPLKPIN